MNTVYETKRLLLREMNAFDFDALHAIFSDRESMKNYPRPFTVKQTNDWISWNVGNYQKFGYGFWAVILKETNEVIGDCGIVYQAIDGEFVPEIGFHINKKFTNKGYATEATACCIALGFNEFHLKKIYSYVHDNDIASKRVVEKNGMSYINSYEDEINPKIDVYAITQE